MIIANTLGVYASLYGEGTKMSILQAIFISAVGFTLVILILSILALFVKTMGKCFDVITEKKHADISAVPAPTPTLGHVSNGGTPLPSNMSEGTLKLVDVTEEEAAIIMAITSHQSGIPLNRLQFNSIKLIGDSEKETTGI